MFGKFVVKIFFMALPGAFLALLQSRFSLEMVTRYPYEPALAFILLSLITGLLGGLIAGRAFLPFWRRFQAIFCLISLFPLIWPGGLHPILGLGLIGLAGGISLTTLRRTEKNFAVFGFLIVSLCGYWGGAVWFLSQFPLLLLGGFAALSLAIRGPRMMARHCRLWGAFSLLLLLGVWGLLLFDCGIFVPRDQSSRMVTTPLGKVTISHNGGDFAITDGAGRVMKKGFESDADNLQTLLPISLQPDGKELRVLYVGYLPSLLPELLERYPYVKTVDTLSWGGRLNRSGEWVDAVMFPGSVLRANLRKEPYDLIVLDNLPHVDRVSRRILIGLLKRNLKSDSGVLVLPRDFADWKSNQYYRFGSRSDLVVLAGKHTTKIPEELEERLKRLTTESPYPEGVVAELYTLAQEEQGEDDFVDDQSFASNKKDNRPFHLGQSHRFWQLSLGGLLLVYLAIRVWKSRYNRVLYLFLGGENGFALGITMVAAVSVLSQYRLLYPYFSPALLGLGSFLVLRTRSRFWIGVSGVAMMAILVDLAIPDLIFWVHPVYFLVPALFFSCLASGNIAYTVALRGRFVLRSDRLSFVLGFLISLLLWLFARDNNFSQQLIYLAILFRVLYLIRV